MYINNIFHFFPGHDCHTVPTTTNHHWVPFQPGVLRVLLPPRLTRGKPWRWPTFGKSSRILVVPSHVESSAAAQVQQRHQTETTDVTQQTVLSGEWLHFIIVMDDDDVMKLHQVPLLLTWINLNPSNISSYIYAQRSVRWNYSSIPKLQWSGHWSVGKDK